MALLVVVLQDYNRRHGMPPADLTAAERLQFLMRPESAANGSFHAHLPKSTLLRRPDRNLPVYLNVIFARLNTFTRSRPTPMLY
jgi:hypothetical protein